MIRLHRLRGEEFYVSADLIESIEATPDTVASLIDGGKLVVAEAAPVDRELRAAVLRTDRLRDTPAELISLHPDRDS